MSGPRHHPARAAALAELAAGAPVAAVAERHGIPYGTVKHWWAQLRRGQLAAPGVEYRPPPPPAVKAHATRAQTWNIEQCTPEQLPGVELRLRAWGLRPGVDPDADHYTVDPLPSGRLVVTWGAPRQQTVTLPARDSRTADGGAGAR